MSSRLAAAMTPEDTRTAMHLGALELLQGGITTTADFFDNILTPAHGEAGLQALEASGIRVVMNYGGQDYSLPDRPRAVARSGRTPRQGRTGADPLGLAPAAQS
ncbi:amidohydrolase family protein [Azotobacter salinestris]|uniref:hypothetical protein n=1 Tax=Azotobacter salinestris TaxID=69964 RepID=UPI001FCC8E92|nr:hypothetical protein [Azotobacter salinestris]